MDDIHSLSEEDIKLRYITPAITQKGWSVNDISMEAKVKLTDGKINLRGNLVDREQYAQSIYGIEKKQFPYMLCVTNMLFFNNEKVEGAQEEFCTKDTWFYRLDMPEGYKHFSKTKPMLVDHCKPMVEWWNNRVEIIDNETGDEKSRCFSAQELLDLGLNFDQCKFPKEEEEVLRPEELLKQYHEKRTALDAKIDQTLSEIQKMLGITID